MAPLLVWECADSSALLERTKHGEGDSEFRYDPVMEESVKEYSVAFDPPAYRRSVEAGFRRNRKKWLGYAFTWAFCGAMIGLVCCWAASYYGSKGQIVYGTALGASFTALGFFLLPYSLRDQQVKQAIKNSTTKSWKCRITPGHFKFESNEGVVASVPWTVLKLEYETSDTFCLSYPGSSLIVFRDPLRDSGLEGLFLERLNER